MCGIWRKIKAFFSSSDTSRTACIEAEIDWRLNEWKVETYSQNQYLHKIPSQRIESKRQEIRRNLGLSSR